jgi:hypothetical protein
MEAYLNFNICVYPVELVICANAKEITEPNSPDQMCSLQDQMCKAAIMARLSLPNDRPQQASLLFEEQILVIHINYMSMFIHSRPYLMMHKQLCYVQCA